MKTSTIVLVLVAASVALGGCHEAMVATPHLIAHEGAAAYSQVPERFQSNEVEVVFVTDRVPEKKTDRGEHYLYHRSPTVGYGIATVELGDDLSWEQIVELTSTPKRASSIPVRVSKIEELGRATGPAAVARIEGETAIESQQTLAAMRNLLGEFDEFLSERLAMTDRKEVFIFVHGYNVKFDDSILPIAQIWHYLGRQGVPMAFSWPAGSGGLLRGYNEDRESSEFAVYHLKMLLQVIAACPDVEGIHLIAHSRGTDLAMSAFREIVIQDRAAGRSVRESLKIKNLVLAAPDLDEQVAAMRIGRERLMIVPERFTVYVSPTDGAIGIADWLFRSEGRIGRIKFSDLDEVALKNLAAAAGQTAFVQAHVKKTSDDPYRHSYFYKHPAVSSDLIRVLRDNLGPDHSEYRPLREVSEGFYELYEGYPFNVPTESQVAPRDGAWYLSGG